jgi:hypothetical protein
VNQASEETAYTLVGEGSNVYPDLQAAQTAALPAVARALADYVRARVRDGDAQACKEQPTPYEV